MANEIKTEHALISLKPNAEWSLVGNKLEWLDSEQTEPSTSEIATEVTKLQTAYDAKSYSRSRKAKYDLLNQDEMRFDDMVNSTTTWIDAIKAIKKEFPKS